MKLTNYFANVEAKTVLEFNCFNLKEIAVVGGNIMIPLQSEAILKVAKKLCEDVEVNTDTKLFICINMLNDEFNIQLAVDSRQGNDTEFLDMALTVAETKVLQWFVIQHLHLEFNSGKYE